MREGFPQLGSVVSGGALVAMQNSVPIELLGKFVCNSRFSFPLIVVLYRSVRSGSHCMDRIMCLPCTQGIVDCGTFEAGLLLVCDVGAAELVVTEAPLLFEFVLECETA